MYAIKGGWVGQTFALATSSDSGGRKSRIRRSKEERKSMVESFIKKYQKLNNGNFPSLNLTHKEVGGSFYTVREIVREVIQENRVLGPAKFPTEEQNNYKLLEQFPLGSISVEPQAYLLPSEETRVTSLMTPNQYHSKSEEDILNSNGQSCGSEHQRLVLDSEQVVNGSNVVTKEGFNSEGPLGTQAISDHHQIANAEQLLSSIEQFNEPNHQEINNGEISSVSEAIEEDEESDEPILVSAMPIPSQEISQERDQETNKEQVLCSGVEYPGNGHLRSDGEEAVNETNQALEKTNECGEPIDRREVAEATLDSAIVQTRDLEVSNGRTGMKADILVEKFPLRPVAKTIHGFEVALSEQANIPKTSEAKGIECDSINSSHSMNVEDVADLAGPTLEKISEPLEEKAVLNIGDSPLESSEFSTTKETLEAQISSLVGEKPLNVTERINDEQNLPSVNSSVARGQPIPEESTASKSRINIQHDSSNKKESSSTLDRINLETWEGASQKPAGPENNPLVALFKAFITALVKFWTE